jgi:putative PIN family toxin of toxin-antitoxin system
VKVVFDTNIFVSAFAIPGGKAEQALQRVIDGRDQLALSRPILLELSGILARKFAHDREQIARIAVFLSEIAEFVEPRTRLHVLKDEPDNRILECAVEVRAEVIVTGDRAMLALGAHKSIRIISLRDYLQTP